MSLIIQNPGALTTVQDAGRTGYMDHGFAVAGAADRDAFEIANLLAGNPINEAVLEATLVGPSIRFEKACTLALAGADMSPRLNEKACPMYQAVSVKENDILECGLAVSGCRMYLAFSGGLDVPKVLGSRSTDLRCALGGYKGRALLAGDVIPLRAGRVPNPGSVRCYEPGNETYKSAPGTDGIPVLRAVAGPQAEAFTREAFDTLEHAVYTISNDSNRMACRLTGEKLKLVNGADIISDGIMNGSIQVSADGLPMVMMADHQTTGGYAKIGTVISSDLPVLAQRKPGEKVRFRLISVEEAQRIYLERKHFMEALGSAYRSE